MSFPLHFLKQLGFAGLWAGASLSVAPLALAQGAGLAMGGEVVELEAQGIEGRVGGVTVAEGEVVLQRGAVTVRADRLSYEEPTDRATAEGAVSISKTPNTFRGPRLEMTVGPFEGFMQEPQFELGAPVRGLQAGGQARRIDFQGPNRFQMKEVLYTSCPRDGSGDPDWFITAEDLRIDMDANEGVARQARLHFLNLPALPMPYLNFAVKDERKSGLLSPELSLDSRSGLILGLPYYFNLAPNYDAILAPRWIQRRGPALGAQARWLHSWGQGQIEADALPGDRLTDQNRWGGRLQQDGHGRILAGEEALSWKLDAAAASDEAYWRDFPDRSWNTLTPRLLARQFEARQPLGRPYLSDQAMGMWDWSGQAYAGTRQWQALQLSSDPMSTPYNQTLRAGVRLDGQLPGDWHWQQDVGLGRFDRTPLSSAPSALEAWRVHALGRVSRDLWLGGLRLTPGLDWNAAHYAPDQALSDGRTQWSRVIPTYSLDARLNFERSSQWGERGLRQVLEPRLLWSRTPYRAQYSELRFDSAARDFFNVFSVRDFSGVDQVSDAHRINLGLTNRWLDGGNGQELLSLGVVQRFLLDDQRITGNDVPITSGKSDLMFTAATSLVPRWTVQSLVNYNQAVQRISQSQVTALHRSGDFRSFGLTHVYVRNGSEQVQLFGQWPLWNAPGALWRSSEGASEPGRAATPSSACARRLYGVGRTVYSPGDRQLTGALLGLELDAGCWYGRVVIERLSAGSAQATTRLSLQIELTGLSRGGSGVGVIRDNVPGYQPLR